jgi:CBS domain-containing protein
MVEQDCGAIPVVDDLRLRQPVGILTDRDIVTRVVAKGLCSYDFVVRDVMTVDPVVLHLNASFHDCARAMEARHVRRIVVVDDRGKVIGIITDGDLARACRAEPELEHALTTMVQEVSGPEHPRRGISPCE